ERYGARGARIRLDHEELAFRDRVLDVDQADHTELQGDPAGRLTNPLQHLLAEAHRRNHTRGVTRIDPRLLHVLHDAGHEAVLSVGERIDVDLDRILEETVE